MFPRQEDQNQLVKTTGKEVRHQEAPPKCTNYHPAGQAALSSVCCPFLLAAGFHTETGWFSVRDPALKQRIEVEDQGNEEGAKTGVL